MIMDEMIPASPGSVLKMTGRPVAKNPFDTSETETWGIMRATSPQSVELTIKTWLHDLINELYKELPENEKEFVILQYDKESTPRRVMEELRLPERKYYRLKDKLLDKTWSYLYPIENHIEIGLQ